MPGAITHLNAAYVFYKRTGIIKNFPMFLLGSVCPDSVNLNGHAPKEIRWPAHLRDSDLSVWEDNAKRFLEDNKGKYDESYLLGYVYHLITDIVWDREYDMPLCTLLYRSGVPKDELKKNRWREIDGYELRQKGTEWLLFSIEELKKAEPLNIGTLKPRNIAEWRKKILTIDFDSSIVSKYVNNDFMESFFDSVCENMLKIMGI